jgi:hypothetical protein
MPTKAATAKKVHAFVLMAFSPRFIDKKVNPVDDRTMSGR